MITSLELGPRDVLVVTVPIANMPTSRSNPYLQEMRGMIRDIIGHDQPLLILPSQGAETTMCILKREK